MSKIVRKVTNKVNKNISNLDEGIPEPKPEEEHDIFDYLGKITGGGGLLGTIFGQRGIDIIQNYLPLSQREKQMMKQSKNQAQIPPPSSINMNLIFGILLLVIIIILFKNK